MNDNFLPALSLFIEKIKDKTIHYDDNERPLNDNRMTTE
jgi:hypothetical protein